MSKLDKLRRDPVLFFEDARQPIVRWAGRLVARRVLARPSVQRVLLDPLEAARQSRLGAVSAAAGRIDALSAKRRRTLFDEHGWPRVSVVMAARNAAETIDAAIESVLSQSYGPIELIVIDDASEDQTAHKALAFAAHDPRVRVERNVSRRGAAWSRNRGLSIAGGGYLTFQDADDVSRPERIERQLGALLAHPSAAICLCSYRRVDHAGKTVVINGRSTGKCIISVFFPRRVLTRVGYFRELPVGEDAEYYERMKAAFGGDKAERLLFATLYEARFSPTSLLFSDGETTVTDAEVTHAPSDTAASTRAGWEAVHQRIRDRRETPFVDFDPEGRA